MNIVIVGGGTAGWLAAYYIVSAQPENHEVTLIESSKIGIVNAGEGSTGAFRELLEGRYVKNKIDIKDFMEKTDSTSKLGIRHNNWTSPGSTYFAPGDFSVTGFKENDYIFKYVLSKFGNQKTHLASKIGIEYQNDKTVSFTYHFDAIKVGQYFKTMCGDKVKTIDAVIKNSFQDSFGNINKIILDDGTEIFGDLFIDCSGFNRILMKKMGINWKSYSKYLSVNTAMPFILKYKDNEKIKPETNATALSSGWMWNIPLTTRRGCGYVFDNNFMSQDQAHKEVEEYLGHEVEPIRFLNFDSGCSEEFWHKNVLALGLSSSFVEPLEATSIHNTIIQIRIFVDFYLFKDYNQTMNEDNRKQYNKYIMSIMDETIDWISMHYQGGREDSDFWKNIKYNDIVTDRAKEILELYKNKLPKHNDVDLTGGTYVLPLANWNIAGVNRISRQMVTKELQETNMYDFAETEYKKYYKSFSHKKT
jgi:flavin-dependent dehydrogenase